MKIFIFQIISLVNAYGCNDISGPFLQKAKSQCYNQANGKINSNTLKDAVKCCMTNTVGDQRVFGVPLMQFRKLERREENAYRRRLPKGFHSIPNHMFKEESPKCTPRNSNDLRKFFNFLDEFKNQRSKTEDNRWDCFLTNDYGNTVDENNFCKRVLNTLEKYERLEDIKRDVCDGTRDTLLPKVFNYKKSLVLDDISKMNHKERKQKQMVYPAHNNGITLKCEERRSSEVRVFQNWNDLASGIINVLFDEENEFSRRGVSRHRINVVRNLECGCIPAKYSKRQSKSNWCPLIQ